MSTSCLFREGAYADLLSYPGVILRYLLDVTIASNVRTAIANIRNVGHATL